ncbi:MAG: type II toxin-antitoxin system RelE/ParE family toxin [Actinomycetota bacterium]|nr:type II toxin-antitoxin system RelE/ParE family toxin [Actinomycetota bacterium]
MKIRFEEEDLKRLYEEPNFRLPRFGDDLVKAFRKKVWLIVAAANENDLRMLKSLHFEKLIGALEGLHSIRINDQWRLLLRLETKDDERVIVIYKVVDYH